MQKILYLILLIFGSCLVGCQNKAKKIIEGNRLTPYEAVVAYVYDGDSFKAKSQGINIQVRLFGIDAPEKKQLYGKESKQNLFKLIKYKRGIIQPIETDKYGRLIAKVYTKKNGVKTYINLEQIKAGLAWHYKRYAKNEKDLAKAELYAKKHKLGLWQHSNPIKPEKWRIKHD